MSNLECVVIILIDSIIVQFNLWRRKERTGFPYLQYIKDVIYSHEIEINDW